MQPSHHRRYGYALTISRPHIILFFYQMSPEGLHTQHEYEESFPLSSSEQMTDC